MYYLSGGLVMPAKMNGCKINLHLKILVVNPSPQLGGKLGCSTLPFLIYSKYSRLHTVTDPSQHYSPVDLERMASNL